MIHGHAGNEIPVFEIAPKGLSGQAPALVDYHGGGFFFSYAGLHLGAAQRYALEGQCRVFFPDYRLSIAHPFPAGFDDCYATLSWVHANAGELEGDPARVALIGDSAGGALAEFDPLHDEGCQYADALQAAGIAVDLREAKGAIHGYDLVAGSPTAEDMFTQRMAAIRSFLGTS